MSPAAEYSVDQTTVDGVTVVRLVDSGHRTEVSILPGIGNLAYEMKVNGKNAFWIPFRSPAEMKEKPALCGNPFLAPWANRLDQDAFYANGKKYALNPSLGNVRRDPNQNPIHGLLAYTGLWRVVEQKADPKGAWVKSRLEYWRYPDLMAQFPFAHTLEMTYRLSKGVLEVETVIENHAVEPMPVAIGYHPYFQVHDAPRDDWTVRIAAREHVKLSRLLIPTGATQPKAMPEPFPLRGTQLDDVFTGLDRGVDGRAVFSVTGKKEKVSVTYGPKYSVAVIYAPSGRDFICFEPMTALTSGFNLAHAGLWAGLQSVPPGGTWRESFWIETSGL